MAIFAITSAESLRNEGIQPKQKARTEDREGIESAAANGNRTDCRWAQVADHDGVNDVHRDPAEFGESHRYRKRENVPDIAPKATLNRNCRSDICQERLLS